MKLLAKILVVVALITITTGAVQAQTDVSSAQLYLALRKLNTLGSVLYIAAHPDDENTRLITYLSKEKGYRTGYLSLTRGDGGQNLIGDEQGVELGLIRTQELLSARRIDGGEQAFTRAFDFGFSKNPAETFTVWNKDSLLADVVWAIRKFQPDVIITRFPTTGEGGHGHHTASAILANEAFDAAADPKMFPQQLAWVQPWQAKRLLWNTFNFGATNTTREDQLKLDVGGYNAVLGKSYGEVAAESRSQHKSQGFGVPRSRGEAIEYFTNLKGPAPTADLMDGINTTWQRMPGTDKVQQLISSTISAFDFLHPEAAVPQLLALQTTLAALPQSVWTAQKQKEIIAVLEGLSGLWLEAFVTTATITAGDSLQLNFTVNNRLGLPAQLQKVSVYSFDTTMNAVLNANKNFAWTKKIKIKDTESPTQPYWLVNDMTTGMFAVAPQQMIGEPDVAPAFNVQFQLSLHGVPVTITKPVRFKFTDPVKGELYQPVVVLPKLEPQLNQPVYLSKNGKPIPATVNVTANSVATPSYTTRFSVSPKWKTVVQSGNAITLQPALAQTLNEKGRAELHTKDGVYDRYRRTIKYDHIPHITYFPKANASFMAADVQIKGSRIGYIVGAGDKVPEALELMGFGVTLLGAKELAHTDLTQFDCIIAGVRAYNTADWLTAYHTKLMKYVGDGGNLIVQYNTSTNIGPIRAKIGPYPFNISRVRVTSETAPVTLLQPEHPAFNFPNKITPQDFEGWVQERSIYHAADIDKAFVKLLRMADAGETSDDASLVVAPYGHGFFTYTGLVFFRQLPAGVPGAYRLLANLIALNQKKEM